MLRAIITKAAALLAAADKAQERASRVRAETKWLMKASIDEILQRQQEKQEATK